jgi:hypothetical protein
VADDISFFEAYEQVLVPLFTASHQLQLVARAEACGLMNALRTESTADELAGSTGVPHRTVVTLCRALVACSVVESTDGERFRLTPAWLALTGPTAYAPLDVVLAGNDVESRLLRGRDGDTFWSMSTAERITYARSVSPDPYSDGLVAAFRKQIEDDADRAAMTSGGRLLELGCGVAGRVLTTLRAMPSLTAVGIELSPDLAAEAQRRALDLVWRTVSRLCALMRRNIGPPNRSTSVSGASSSSPRRHARVPCARCMPRCAPGACSTHRSEPTSRPSKPIRRAVRREISRSGA